MAPNPALAAGPLSPGEAGTRKNLARSSLTSKDQDDVAQRAKMMANVGSAWHAVKIGDLQVITKLFPGSNVFARGPVGENVLHVAMLLNTPSSLAIAKYLVKHYGKGLVNMPFQKRMAEADAPGTYEGQTALHIAIVNCDLDMVKFLVAQGADVRARAFGPFFKPSGVVYHGELPLSFAACTGQKEMVSLLQRHGALVNADRDTRGNAALHMAVITDQVEMYDFLVKYCGASEHVVNHDGMTPFVLAARLGKLDMFTHIYNKRRRVAWAYGPISCYSLSLHEIDSVQTGSRYVPSALETIVRKCARQSHYEMLDDPLVQLLLVNKWRRFAGAQFVVQTTCYMVFVISQTFLIWLYCSPLYWNTWHRCALEYVGVIFAGLFLVLESFDFSLWLKGFYRRRSVMKLSRAYAPALHNIPGETERVTEPSRLSFIVRLTHSLMPLAEGRERDSSSGSSSASAVEAAPAPAPARCLSPSSSHLWNPDAEDERRRSSGGGGGSSSGRGIGGKWPLDSCDGAHGGVEDAAVAARLAAGPVAEALDGAPASDVAAARPSSTSAAAAAAAGAAPPLPMSPTSSRPPMMPSVFEQQGPAGAGAGGEAADADREPLATLYQSVMADADGLGPLERPVYLRGGPGSTSLGHASSGRLADQMPPGLSAPRYGGGSIGPSAASLLSQLQVSPSLQRGSEFAEAPQLRHMDSDIVSVGVPTPRGDGPLLRHGDGSMRQGNSFVVPPSPSALFGGGGFRRNTSELTPRNSYGGGPVAGGVPAGVFDSGTRRSPSLGGVMFPTLPPAYSDPSADGPPVSAGGTQGGATATSLRLSQSMPRGPMFSPLGFSPGDPALMMLMAPEEGQSPPPFNSTAPAEFKNRPRNGGGDLGSTRMPNKRAATGALGDVSITGGMLNSQANHGGGAAGGGGGTTGGGGGGAAGASAADIVDADRAPSLDPGGVVGMTRTFFLASHEYMSRKLRDPALIIMHFHSQVTFVHFVTWAITYGFAGGSGPSNVRVQEFDDLMVSMMGLTGWLGALYYARGFEGTGKAVAVLERCAVDVGKYLVLYFLCNIGFTLAFYTLYKGTTYTTGTSSLDESDEERDRFQVATPFSSIGYGMLQLVRFMYGEAQWDTYARVSFGSKEAFATIFFLFYVAIVLLLLMNLLTAMIIHTYASMQDTARRVWQARWAAYVLRAEARMPMSLQQRWRTGEKTFDPLLGMDVYATSLEVFEQEEDSKEAARDVEVRQLEALLAKLRLKRDSGAAKR